MISLSQIIFRFRLAICLYWAFSGAFLCYYVLYFEDQKKISAADIGLMMSLYTLSAILGQNFFGYISDKWRGIRKPVIGGAVLLALVVPTFLMHDNILWIYPSMALVGFLQQPMGPMLDSWVLKHLSRHKKENLYGKIRSFGSLGWSTSALLTAYLIKLFGWHMMYWVAVTAAILLVLVVSRIPDIYPGVNGQGVEREKLTFLKAIQQLFGIRAYVYILIVVFLLFLGVQTAYNFMGLIIKNTGGGVEALGWTFFLDAGSEIPAMFLSVWLLSRSAPRNLMVMAVVLYLIRFSLILYFQDPLVITITGILGGFAYGLMLTSLRRYIFEVAPVHLQTSALTICDAVLLSLSVMVGGALGGWIIQQYSVISLMAFCMAFVFSAFLLILFGRRYGVVKPAEKRVA